MSDRKIREAFEVWCFGRQDTQKIATPSGWINYRDPTTESAWQGYQAARQSALEEAVQACKARYDMCLDRESLACIEAIRSLASEQAEVVGKTQP